MKKSAYMLGILLVTTMLALAGCGEKEYEAAAVNEAVDKCEVCNMQVSDNGFATQLITNEGKVYKFDDIGCMNEWKVKNGTDDIAIEFVQDQSSREWLKLDNAYFAYDPSFKTPMAYGLVSFKVNQSAQDFIDEQGKGKLLSAADLSSHTWERNKGSMHMQMDDHDESEHMESDTKRSM